MKKKIFFLDFKNVKGSWKDKSVLCPRPKLGVEKLSGNSRQKTKKSWYPGARRKAEKVADKQTRLKIWPWGLGQLEACGAS